MRRLITIFFAIVAGANPLWGQSPPAEEGSFNHPWAQFGVGSWKKVRVFTETLAEDGNVQNTSSTETRTTLVALEQETYTLKVEVVVEVSGKRFQAEPRFVKQGFYGEVEGQKVEVKSLRAEDLRIGGRSHSCQVLQVVINGDGTRKVSTLHYAADTAPYVLRREIKGLNADGEVDSNESLVEVIAIDMPYRVLTQVKLVSYVRTVRKQSNGVTTSTIEVQCSDVPGGVVTHSSKEVDASGKTVRRSTLELKDYEVVRTVKQPSRVIRRRLFPRLRSHN